ncbi:hypothetical protein F2P79_002384 [Pimephales promelas]|nr:hypothetical protein F2P79_002384 [Pimephales promelas]
MESRLTLCLPEGTLDLWHVESRTASLMVECEALPRHESCQRHSIKGDYAVCRCASLCLPNDWLLTFSPCLLPAGGTGASEDQLPPVLLPRSLAETLLLPARWALRVEQAVEPPVSLLSHLPYTHLYIHTHRLSALPEAFAVSSSFGRGLSGQSPFFFFFFLTWNRQKTLLKSLLSIFSSSIINKQLQTVNLLSTENVWPVLFSCRYFSSPLSMGITTNVKDSRKGSAPNHEHTV